MPSATRRSFVALVLLSLILGGCSTDSGPFHSIQEGGTVAEELLRESIAILGHEASPAYAEVECIPSGRFAQADANIALPEGMLAAEAADLLGALWESRGLKIDNRVNDGPAARVLARGEGLVAGASIFDVASISITTGCFSDE